MVLINGSPLSMQLAQQDLGAVLRLQPGNAEAAALLEELQAAQREVRAAEKQLASGMVAAARRQETIAENA